MDAKAKVVAHVVFGKPEDYPPVAIQEYAGSISVIRDRVMANAHREGFHGDFVTRMADLGWWLEPLVTLTDHEAALAEVEERRDHWHDYSVRRVEEIAELTERHAETERNACLMAELANEEKSKRLALLTGLEALAGELKEDSEDKDLSDVWRSACVYYAHRVGLLTTLTNSAKGGA